MAADPTELADPNPLLTKQCAQQVLMAECDDDDEVIQGSEYEDTCGLPLVWERHGDEIVYMCTEHGWQATLFADGSGK